MLLQYLFSQTTITLTIKDADTKEPLPFCNVVIKGTSNGGITNTDGKIKLTINSANDIIEISFLGYETKLLKINELNNTNTIFLNKQNYILSEIEVRADNDYLYEIIEKCRKKMLKNNNKNVSKAYFSVETKSDDKILEFLECYYNANLSGHKINSLDFKNGKTNLNTIENSIFLSYNTSLSLQYLDLLNEKDYFFPSLILQVDKYAAKRSYIVKEEERNENYYLISFKPRKKRDKDNTFSGSLWIDKQNFDLLKIYLKIDTTSIHPFETQPFYNGISNVNLEITQTFNKQENTTTHNYFIFDYSFDYYSFGPFGRKLASKINSHSLLYFYDYEKPFVLPFFEYQNGDTDYQKMATFPYNKVFWDNAKSVLITESQQKNYKLLNYSTLDTIYDYNSEGEYGVSFLSKMFKKERTQVVEGLLNNHLKPMGVFLYSYVFWTKEDRLIIYEKPEQLLFTKTYGDHGSKFVVQLLLDITELEDSIHWQSFTIYDPTKSYFQDTINQNLFACVNIYFDLCEIKRREMDTELQQNHKTVKEITNIYNKYIKEIEDMRKQYFKEVNLGINFRILRRYNAIVKEKLDIDNMAMFKDFYKQEEDKKKGE